MKNTIRTMRAVLACCLVTVLVTACSIRLETPAPGPLVPGPNETARQAAVNDVNDILSQSQILIELLADGRIPTDSLPSSTEEITPVLVLINNAAQAHYDALGGDYTGEAEPTTSPRPTPSPPTVEPTIDPTLYDLLDKLSNSYLRARASLPLIADAELARLIGSMSLAQLQQGTVLAKILEVEPPLIPAEISDIPPVIPDPDHSDPVETPNPTSTATPNQVGIVSSTLVPFTLPDGVNEELMMGIITDEDLIGYTLEVLAAYRPEPEVVITVQSAHRHSERAEQWSMLMQVSRTDDDPRLLHYNLDNRALGQTPSADNAARVTHLNGQLSLALKSLTDHYLLLTYQMTPEQRVIGHDLAADAALEYLRLHPEPQTFPGLPEQRG